MTSPKPCMHYPQCYNVHACEQYTTVWVLRRHPVDVNDQKTHIINNHHRSDTSSPSVHSSSNQELYRNFSLRHHSVRALLHRQSQNSKKVSSSTLCTWQTLFCSFVLLFLSVTHCNALPMETETNGFDTSFLATPKPKLTSAQHQPFFITAVNRKEPLNIRVLRGALTPPVKPLKTSPQKRGVDSVSNSHHSPQRLVTKVGGFYMEIKKNGRVKGTRKLNAYSVLEFFSVKTGVIVIKGKRSGRYLAMDRKGRLKGLKKYTEDCYFHEGLVENNYFIFYREIEVRTRRRLIVRQLYMGFDRRGRPTRKSKKLQRNDSAAHFQKIMATYPVRKRKRPKKPRNKRKRPRIRKPKYRKNKKIRTHA